MLLLVRCFLSKNLGAENVDVSIIRFPGVSGQACLNTSLLEKS